MKNLLEKIIPRNNGTSAGVKALEKSILKGNNIMKTHTPSHLIIDKTFQGAITISKYKGADLIKRQYMGYSLTEAKQLFKQYYENN